MDRDSSLHGIIGNRLTILPETTVTKTEEIYETTVFKHWTMAGIGE